MAVQAVQLHPVRNPREDAGAGVQNVQNWTVSVNMCLGWLQLWLVITGDFYGIIHSINWVFLVLIYNLYCKWYFGTKLWDGSEL